MLAAYRGNLQPPAGDALRTHIRHLMGQSSQAGGSPQSANDVDAKFEWGEYEQLMIAEAVHRGEKVYNVGLRIDPTSQMRAAALQLIRNVLYGAGTVLALRPEDNLSAEHVEIVEAALATSRSREWLLKKCRIPAVVSGIIVERSVVADTPEHEMIGALLDSEAAAVTAGMESAKSGASPSSPAPAKGVAAVVAEGTLRVESGRIDAVMNLVGELIIGKSMFHRAVHEFDQRFAKDPLRARLNDALAFQSRVLNDLQKSVMKIRMVPVEQLFRRLPRIVRDVAKLRGRDVALELAGQNTDLDKGILDSLGEPPPTSSAMPWTTGSSRRKSALPPGSRRAAPSV
jgi:two-component system chemotaxis sensor kinase CheA